jgi:hypothetical protein
MDDTSGTQEAIERASRRGLEDATPPLEFGELGGTKPCRIG